MEWHEKLKNRAEEPCGARKQHDRAQAEGAARIAESTGDRYDELVAEGARHASKDDWRKAVKTYREAIALQPQINTAYFLLATALANSGGTVEAAQWFLECKKRFPVGSPGWAQATALAYRMLREPDCDEVAKPAWWNDECLKTLSKRVVRAAPNEESHFMRARVLSNTKGPPPAQLRSLRRRPSTTNELLSCAMLRRSVLSAFAWRPCAEAPPTSATAHSRECRMEGLQRI